jgi:REP element-mobilizing transposase RayT
MARRARKEIVQAGLPHHIGLRGNNRRRLFSYKSDYQRFVDYLHESIIRHHVDLHQLTLMPNHAHLIAVPPEADSLSQMMATCQQRYARYRNDSRGGSGRLFEERFWCAPLWTPYDVEKVTLYADSNAMKAAMVEHPADHVWSTCSIHYGQPERSNIPVQMWTPSDWYLSLGPDAPIVYEQRMTEYLAGRIPDWCHERMLAIESMASLDFRGRIERPDGSSAREPTEKRSYVYKAFDSE